jgi:hypothetical protein
MAVRIAAGVSSAILMRYFAWTCNIKLPLFPGFMSSAITTVTAATAAV